MSRHIKITVTGDEQFDEIIDWCDHNCAESQSYPFELSWTWSGSANHIRGGNNTFSFRSDVDATLFVLRWL
jgi:hypothetical protein